MSTTPATQRTLKGREILGGVADLLSAWLAVGGTLVQAWRTLNAKRKRALARPLVRALVRRFNRHRQEAWLEFVSSPNRLHSKSREGHFILLSPRTFQDRGRRRADPFTETTVLKLLNAYRTGKLPARDTAWIVEGLCYAAATTLPGAKERVADLLPPGRARAVWAQARRLFRPRARCCNLPLPEELRQCLSELVCSEDGRVGRFNQVWRERLVMKGTQFAPPEEVISAADWLVEHLDPKPATPPADLAAFCERMIVLGRFGQQLRLQFPVSGQPGRIRWTDRLAQNLIRGGKLAELLLHRPADGPAAAEAPGSPSDFFATSPPPLMPEEERTPPSLLMLPGQAETTSGTAEAALEALGLTIGDDLPEIEEDEEEFQVGRARRDRLDVETKVDKNVPDEDQKTYVLRQDSEAPTLPTRKRPPLGVIQFHCTACRRLLRVTAANAGRRFRCPACSAESKVPALREPEESRRSRARPPVPPAPPSPAEDVFSLAAEAARDLERTLAAERSRREASEPPTPRKARRRRRKGADTTEPPSATAVRTGWRRVRSGLLVISYVLIGWAVTVGLTLVVAFLIPVVAGGTARLGNIGNDLGTAEKAGQAWMILLLILTALSSLVNIAQIIGYSLCLYVPNRPDAVAWSIGALALTALSCGLYVIGLVVPVIAFVAILVGMAGWGAFLFFLRAVGLQLDVVWVVQEIKSLAQFLVVGAGTAGIILFGLFIIIDEVTDPHRAGEGLPGVLLLGIVIDIVLFAVLLLVVPFRYLHVLRDISAQVEEETAARARPQIGESTKPVGTL